MGDFIAISELATKVCTAFKDAPEDYKHIAEEVNSLRILINKATQHLERTTLSNKDRQEGLEILKGCQSVFRDLNSLIEKYNSLASTSISIIQVFDRLKLGTEDIENFRARLQSNVTMLGFFIQRFDSSTMTI